MAWRSSGTTNDEMVDNLKRFQIILSLDVEAGFRSVDRELFVPKLSKEIAHKDQPIRENNIHISAPHIYGSVIEALDLKKGAGFSVLNAGSGTGYLTCIAASILGPRSVHYCVEIHEDVIRHCKEAIAAWEKTNDQGTSNIDIIHGNALELNTNKGECAFGFDRIYIGAAIHRFNLHMFKKMLKPGGVLVGPVGDELVKITRSQIENSESNQQFVTRVISGVRFSPLLSSPSIHIVIPPRIWDPSNHTTYPDSFHGACNELLLCSNASRTQPVKICPKKKVNVASMLPRALWVEILSFTHRNWFDVPMNEVDFLKKRLTEEQANVQAANQAKIEAESRCRLAERERDIYKILARTLRSRLTSSMPEGSDSSDDIIVSETALGMVFRGRESFATFGSGRLLRRLAQDINDEEMGDAGDEEFDFSEDDDDDDDMSETMEDDDDDDNDEEDSDNDESLSVSSDHRNHFVPVNLTMLHNLRAEGRTVSISEGDVI
mmetsp:Transcript_24200/g.51399  ORF Transcript_24200/g.51399 Transcript_24200/m.51399 type:complete len:491 (-) Transcript_24200:2821-4293(-)|eukprot:CAMPEP_0201269462 /NCGR_PEP_ID=MMETSP0853-20130426/32599_1 /ASSEMBLY_ACC=CAM_ASM_000640 /TAXON_ID=183588 /ORGANISM="Pseudo-nitzschia fraudulenta, Strain WWA7" /LENGTH=490 /DNA_ID=CAMNT_0047575463 /DNA_START=129 /DNA_END=1601 /DNA_ORIENTATION=+